MPYLNSRLHALVAMSLLLLTAPSLLAQDEASVVSTEIRGDVDGDGRVTAADAEAVRAYLVRGTVPAGREIMPAGDANADGRVTAADAALISRYAAGVDVSRFPVGRRVDEGGGRTFDLTGSMVAEYECTTSVTNGATSCRAVSGPAGAQTDLMAGFPWVRFTATRVDSIAGTTRDTLVLQLTMHNDSLQSIGTLDGSTPDTSRIFYKTHPLTVTANYERPRALVVNPVDALPGATFTNAGTTTTYNNRRYYEVVGVIEKGESASTTATFVYDRRVTSFTYVLLVATRVARPFGWVTIDPLADSVIALDSAVTLTGVVRDAYGIVQGSDAINWTSSNTSVATVNPSTGEVVGVGEGTTTIRAASVANNNRTDSLRIVVDRFPEVVSTEPSDGDVNISPDTTIQITFTEPVNVTTNSFDLKCPSSGSALPYAISGDGTATITLTPSGDLPSGTVCEVTVKGNQVTDVDTNDGPNFMPGQYVFDFEVGIQALADSLTSTTTGNVRINTAGTSPVFSVITNDKIGPATTITFAGWGGVADSTKFGGDVVMTMSGAGMGQFIYNPPAGYEGVDSLEYTITSGSSSSSAKVQLPVSGMIWFVNNGATACTSRASADGCGRLTNPYSTLAAFHAENNGTGNNPAAGDNVFLYESAAAYTGPVALLPQQKLIGQDAGASLSDITGITPATGSDPLPGMNPGGNAVNITGASGGVVLANIGASSGANNTVRGLSIGTSGGAGLSGTSFGSPVIEEVPISVTGGPSLSLNGGTMNSTFATASSSGSSTQGLSLTDVSGTLTFGSGTSLTNSNGTGFFVSGAAPVITYSGGISKNAAIPGRLVEINNVTGGTITFNTGTLSSTSTAGTGIQLSNADGAVNFNGTVTLTGGDNGVDIIAGSSGAIDFDAATITNPSGEALRIFNGSGGDQPANVTFDGAISTNAGRPVLIEDVSGGTVAVNASINTTAGLGVLVQNNTGGTFTFSHATQVLNTGGNAAFTMLNNTGTSTVNFTGGNLDIDVTSGAGFTATGGGTVSVTGANNTVNATAGGVAVNVANTTIAAAGLNFLRVAANGGASGIILNTTGTSGGLTVAGSGAAGTGGTIQNTSGPGISLTNTTSPSFSRMIIQSTGSHGISGALVNNFTLTNSTVTISGTSEVPGRQESNLSFYQNAGTGTERNLTGAVTITGNTLNNALHHGINITQYDGTISSLNISNNSFTSATASSGSSTGATTSHGSAISINPIGSGATIASVTSGTISNNTITGFPGNAGILFIGGNTNVGGPSGTYGTAGDSITIQSNRIRGHSSANLMNTQAMNIAVGARGTGFFRVVDNGTIAEPITNMAGHAITVSALGQATVGIRLTNNRIVANNTVGSQGISMGVDTASGFATTAVVNATVNSNTISATHGSGIFALATRRGTMNAKILNNSVAAPASGTYGIQLVAATTLANTGTGCFSISGNTTAGGVNGGTTFPGIGLRRQSGAATAPNVFGIVGLPGGSTATPAVENYVNSLNTSASGTFGIGGTALISASSGFSSCTLSF